MGVKRRQRPGTRLHHTPTLSRRDATTRHGIPTTSLPRTLVDLAEQTTRPELERALNESRVLHRITDAALHAAIARAGHRHGAAKLAHLLRQERGPGITRKELERRMLNLLRRARLPLPETNQDVRGLEVDFLWPDHKLVVETDGWQTHSTRRAFENDRRRDAELQAAGYRVVRFTYRQITGEPEATLILLATLIR